VGNANNCQSRQYRLAPYQRFGLRKKAIEITLLDRFSRKNVAHLGLVAIFILPQVALVPKGFGWKDDPSNKF
jgi:hypothetical protein